MLSRFGVLSRRGALVAGLAAIALGQAGMAVAQDWPSRPVTMVVPYGPGASNDTFTRALSEILTRNLGQPFVVENRPGAGGFTGANSVVQSAADGYTYLEMPNSIAGFKPVMKVDLDPLVNLQPVAMFAKSPIAMVVPSSLPVTTVQEFVAYAKANQATTFYGYAGTGTAQHQHAELFNLVTGLDLDGVNYKSSADAQTDLVAGRLSLMFVTVASTLGQIESGQLRLLGYTDSNFPDTAPKAPTLKEAGIDGMQEAQSFWNLFAPAGLPEDILMKMNAEINKAVNDPSFLALLAKSGATPFIGTPQDLIDALAAEQVLVNDFVKRLNL